MKQVLLVDNYDSFTFNLYHSLEKNDNVKVTVVRNDRIINLNTSGFDKIVLSPGPGVPLSAGDLLAFIEKHYQHKSILGVCLGHQAIGQFFGAEMKALPQVLHGIQLETRLLPNSKLFKDLPETIYTGHYHSWVLNENNFPSNLAITAYNKEGGIMAFEHQTYDICGIQFHPESVLTPQGDLILSNWLNNKFV
ncbi:MAG TPA: aminodeoxychorismate/anthranilate synthase component II [Bacteroidia bacterium]|nr:aminodeoxychorismate/anthranilate synthase component II [Bacteroidia bacterium]